MIVARLLPIPAPIRVEPIRFPRIHFAPPRMTPPDAVVRELVRRVSEAVVRSVRQAALPAPPPVEPVQLSLLPEAFAPLDPARIDLAEKLSDGKPRFINAKQAGWLMHLDEDTVIRRVRRDGIGVKVGGRYWIDRTRITGRI